MTCVLTQRCKEQFTEEWDWVVRVPTSKHRIAGKYGWWTNVFQVGRVCKPHPSNRPARRIVCIIYYLRMQ